MNTVTNTCHYSVVVYNDSNSHMKQLEVSATTITECIDIALNDNPRYTFVSLAVTPFERSGRVIHFTKSTNSIVNLAKSISNPDFVPNAYERAVVTAILKDYASG